MVGIFAILAAGLAGPAAPATAATTTATASGGWQRAVYGPYTEAAGTDCAFTLHVDVVRQDVWYRTIDIYPNGSPKDQIFVGPLYQRYTNKATGTSLVGNLSGSAEIHYDPDGTQHWYVLGPFGVTFNTGNPYHGPGEYIIGGLTVLVLHAGNVPQVTFHDGPIEDVCTALS